MPARFITIDHDSTCTFRRKNRALLKISLHRVPGSGGNFLSVPAFPGKLFAWFEAGY